MAIRSGLAAQLGMALETTVGTYQVPTHFYEPDSENVNYTIARLASTGLRQNNRVLRTDRWAAGKQTVTGDIPMEVLSKSFGLWFQAALGAAPVITASGSGWLQTFSYGDPYGQSLTVQIGRPGAGGTVVPFSYTGCKVSAWELSNAVDGTLMFKPTLDGWTETQAQTLATVSYPTTAELFYFTEGAITVGGASTYNISNWTLTDTVGIKSDRYFIGSPVKKEQIINAFSTPTGTLTAEFTDATGYNLYVNGTVSSLVLTYTTVDTYSSGLPYTCTITVPNCRFDGNTPNVAGPEVLNFTGNFVVLNDGTTSPITIAYASSDAAP